MRTTTRKILLSIAFCFAMMSTKAQYVTIPDTNFVNWLNANGYANCMVGNQMDTTCSVVVNATSVDCRSNNIYDMTGISYFDNLQFLYCGGWNYFSALPTLPSSLLKLNCWNNANLGSLPTLPSTMWTLDVSGCNLSVLPTLPSGLTELYCGDVISSNNLTSLPSLPSNLLFLNCDNNQISNLPSLPSSLSKLSCIGNLLTSLPTLPSSLTVFDCSDNVGLSSLIPLLTLPSILYDFGCVHCNLTTLPALPSSLVYLYCSYNQLTVLPFLPSSLTDLNCEYNMLTSLPAIPSGLVNISCNNNLLNSLSSLPYQLNYLGLENNPGLKCLPQLNYINSFYWANTGITCLPNSLTVGAANPPITNVPLCAFSNFNNCPVFWSISGKTFTDTNSNCLLDTNEVLLSKLKVKLYSGGILKQQAFSNDLGQYAFTSDTGNYVYSIDTNYLPLNVICPPSFSFNTTITNGNPQNPNKDFSLQCKPGFDIGASSIINSSGRFRPANYATVNILGGDISNHYNLHCAAGVSGTVTVIINGPASYVSSIGALTPVVNGNILTYTIADFGTINFQNDFSFIVQTDTTAQAGQQVCFDVSVTPVAGDNNTANNNYTQCFTVTNSYDPNEKEVSPSGVIDTSQRLLTYTIYFQNTGNDTAQFIIIEDTLDNDIDESSIQLLAYSHDPLVQVIGNVVKFNFPNINLPDSTTDEPNSHGYVQYRVRLNNSLAIGTPIHNTAYIYFDFNAPVQTNTTLNEVGLTTGIVLKPSDQTFFRIYPNPIVSTGNLKIVFNSSTDQQALFTIYDFSGRTVFVKTISSASQIQSIALPALAAGIYNCVISSANANSYQKLVVLQGY